MDATLIEQLFSVQPSAFSVSLCGVLSAHSSTTETQRTRRLHREDLISLPIFIRIDHG